MLTCTSRSSRASCASVPSFKRVCSESCSAAAIPKQALSAALQTSRTIRASTIALASLPASASRKRASCCNVFFPNAGGSERRAVGSSGGQSAVDSRQEAAALSLPTAYCLLPTAYCLLPTAYCQLPTAYCLLPTVTSGEGGIRTPEPLRVTRF